MCVCVCVHVCVCVCVCVCVHVCMCVCAHHVALLVLGLQHLGHVLQAVAVGRLHACCRERHGDDALRDVGQVQVKLLVYIAITAPGGTSEASN